MFMGLKVSFYLPHMKHNQVILSKQYQQLTVLCIVSIESFHFTNRVVATIMHPSNL